MEYSQNRNHPCRTSLSLTWLQRVIFLGLFFLCCHPVESEFQKKMTPSADLNQQEAHAIAVRVLYDSKPEAEYVILEDKTLERDFGWVFFYSPRQYLETRNPSYLVPGAGPL